MTDRPTIVFLHGLGRTANSMRKLQRHVEAAGYPTWSRTYPSRRAELSELAGTVADWINTEIEGPVSAVTHSMGGILVRHMGDRVPWQRIVMLAPPNGGSAVANGLRNWKSYQFLFGPAGLQVGDSTDWPPAPAETGVIAGTLGPSIGNPPSWIVAGLKLLPEGPSDGTVTVAEAKTPNLADFATVPASHSWIMNHPRTKALVLRFLEAGSF